jgi:hypothetical protein
MKMNWISVKDRLPEAERQRLKKLLIENGFIVIDDGEYLKARTTK